MIALFAVSLLAFSEPNWAATLTTNRTQVGRPFVIDGIDTQIDKVSAVANFADGTAPDQGARVIEVQFWLHNPLSENADMYDRFYAYATLSDGTDTNGDGLSFFPLDSAKEMTDITLKPGETAHARFDFEVPTNTKTTGLVIFGPIDGAKITIPIVL